MKELAFWILEILCDYVVSTHLRLCGISPLLFLGAGGGRIASYYPTDLYYQSHFGKPSDEEETGGLKIFCEKCLLSDWYTNLFTHKNWVI